MKGNRTALNDSPLLLSYHNKKNRGVIFVARKRNSGIKRESRLL